MSEVSRALKVFVCGDVEGKFNMLFSRVSSIQSKMGQFDLLFCLGNFFGEDVAQWQPYKNGEKTVPVTTYVLGPSDDVHAQHFMNDEGQELCNNVAYLGKKGIFTSSSGLTVAYLSGLDGGNKDDFSHFSTADIQALQETILSSPKFKGIDILLTSVWPKGVSNHGTPLNEHPKNDSANVAQLALTLKPRYHFSATEGISYERNPYRNHKVLGGTAQHVTRFIALANVGNKEKSKFLYAFNIVPLKHMVQDELIKQPIDASETPYTRAAASERSDETTERSAIFYGEKPKFAGKKRPSEASGDGPESKQSSEPPKPRGPCWFCLGSPEVEKHMVVSVGLHTYVALAKGALNDQHVLIMPIGHFQSLVTCSEEVLEEIGKNKEALQKFFKSQGKGVVFFERNFKTSHMQIQVVPVPDACVSDCAQIFLSKAEEQNISLSEIPVRSDLRQIVPAGKTYFYAELPAGEKLFHRINSNNFPLQFGREVLADKAILNKPGASDWRQCVLSKEKETDVAKTFMKEYKPFDINAL